MNRKFKRNMSGSELVEYKAFRESRKFARETSKSFVEKTYDKKEYSSRSRR